jgi:hypothetical protein
MLIATGGYALVFKNLVLTLALFYCIFIVFYLFILIQFDYVILACNLSYYTNMLVRNPL